MTARRLLVNGSQFTLLLCGGEQAAVDCLLELGAQVDAIGSHLHRTALIAVCGDRSDDKKDEKKKEGMVRHLIARGADVRKADRERGYRSALCCSLRIWQHCILPIRRRSRQSARTRVGYSFLDESPEKHRADIEERVRIFESKKPSVQERLWDVWSSVKERLTRP